MDGPNKKSNLLLHVVYPALLHRGNRRAWNELFKQADLFLVFRWEKLGKLLFFVFAGNESISLHLSPISVVKC